MKWFTGDWHLGEDRYGINEKPNLLWRPFNSIDEHNYQIRYNFVNSGFKDGDSLYDLGDVVYKDEGDSWDILKQIRNIFPKSKFILIAGNYDVDKLSTLKHFYDDILEETVLEIKNKEYYLNHYPEKCVDKKMALTGHIHGLWKVQKNMINVGVDVWHFKPINEDTVDFCRTAVEKYYDTNVFPY